MKLTRSQSVVFSLLLGLSWPLARVAQAAWPTDPSVNVPLCQAPSYQYMGGAVADGSGGAIVVWMDDRDTDHHVYVQRVSGGGSPLWTTDGVEVCTQLLAQQAPLIASDGAGGAIVVWADMRAGADMNLYAQRILSNGTPAWTLDGIPVCEAEQRQLLGAIVADGTGGAIIAWHDQRAGGGNSDDIYAQRISANGGAQWTPDGLPLCTVTGSQRNAVVLPDGTGGAIVAWEDDRDPTAGAIRAQRISPAGDLLWASGGAQISAAPVGASSQHPSILGDGAGGAIIAWMDTRSGSLNAWAQRVASSGAVQWGNGVAVCAAAGYQYYPQLVSDGAGGAIVTWYDYRFSNWDVYAQRISAAGAKQWTASGVVICNYYDDQITPLTLPDGAGGAIIAWSDQRDTPGVGNIYAQRISGSGAAQWPTYGGTLVCSASADQSDLRIVPDGAGGAIVAWSDARNGYLDIYAQRIQANGQLGGSVASVPGESVTRSRLEAVSPNPSRGRAPVVRFTLASAAPASLEVVDVAGRRLSTREVGALGPGPHTIDLDSHVHLAPGLYMVRLRAESIASTQRLVVVE